MYDVITIVNMLIVWNNQHMKTLGLHIIPDT